MRRIIICGSRSWTDRELIESRFYDLARAIRRPTAAYWPTIVIVHGNARGADRIAHQEALKAGFIVEPHPADWDTYGKKAGFIRNEEMAKLGADLCIAFWDGTSNGTRHMVDRALAHGIDVEIIGPQRPLD